MATTYLRCADTAKMLRGALKTAFPGVKFSVRSHTYAGGASIRVSWVDGPVERDVKAVTDLYTGATFDGMTDMKSHHTTLLADPDGAVSEVSMGADFIFTDRVLSHEWEQHWIDQIHEKGHDSMSSRCDVCGNWLPAGDRWVARYTDWRGLERIEFCCSVTCAGQRVARYTAATDGRMR